MSQFTHAAPRLYLRARGLHVFRLLLIGIIVLITMALVVPQAGAVSYNYASQGACISSFAVGDSWLNWSGGYFWDWGKSWGYLYWWYNSHWVQTASSYAEAQGSANNALAHDFTSPTAAGQYWWQSGAHQASFFSGTKYSSGNVFTCF